MIYDMESQNAEISIECQDYEDEIFKTEFKENSHRNSFKHIQSTTLKRASELSLLKKEPLSLHSFGGTLHYCSDCRKEFNSKKMLNRHRARGHLRSQVSLMNKDGDYNCRICGFEAKSLYALKRHLHLHHLRTTVISFYEGSRIISSNRSSMAIEFRSMMRIFKDFYKGKRKSIGDLHFHLCPKDLVFIG